MKARQQLQKIQSLKSYHYLKNGFDPAYTVHARDVNHAIEKLSALYGIEVNPSLVVSHQEYIDMRDAALEPLGKAPWQRQLVKQELKNRYPLGP